MVPPEIASENVLVLAEQPGDELRFYGGLIDGLCRAGRPPFVVVLTDGPVLDPAADRIVRQELAGLGLEGGRMLMFGIAGALPSDGPVFDAAVRSLCFVSWRHDCNVLLAPQTGPAASLARAAAAESGLGLAEYGAASLRLVVAPQRSTRDEGP